MIRRQPERRRAPRPGRHVPPWQVRWGGVTVEVHGSRLVALLTYVSIRWPRLPPAPSAEVAEADSNP